MTRSGLNVLVLGIVSVPDTGSAQTLPSPNPPYNPYPTGLNSTPPSILPPGLNAEIARVRQEVRTVFQRYMAEWNALSPTPTNIGNPPILAPNGYDAQRILGGLLNFDENISPFRNEACAFCHMPYVAFSGPMQSVNLTMIAYPGSYHYRAAKRTASLDRKPVALLLLRCHFVIGDFRVAAKGRRFGHGILLRSPASQGINLLAVGRWRLLRPGLAGIAARPHFAAIGSA